VSGTSKKSSMKRVERAFKKSFPRKLFLLVQL